MSKSNKTLEDKCKKHVIEIKTIGKEIQNIKDDIEKVTLSSKDRQHSEDFRVQNITEDIHKMKEDLENRPKYAEYHQIAGELKGIKKEIHQIKNDVEKNIKSGNDEQNNDTFGILQEELKCLKIMCQDLKNFGQSTPNDRHNIKAIEHKKISYTDIEIKEEVLLLVDSNGAKVDESMLSKDVACKKVFTPTWNHVKDMLQALNGKCLKIIKQICVLCWNK